MLVFKRFIIILFALSLVACGDEKKAQTPDAAAIDYFKILYHEKDVKKLMENSSKRMARIINSYGTVRSVQRHVVNQRYDEVEISVDPNARRVRSAFAKNSKILVVFKGYVDGKRVDDIRDVHLIREGDRWLVDRIEEGTMG